MLRYNRNTCSVFSISYGEFKKYKIRFLVLHTMSGIKTITEILFLDLSPTEFLMLRSNALKKIL